ncbi:MAG: imidazole glycerol phosphate synthase subunit HisH [Patescibacteria group bacterium]
MIGIIDYGAGNLQSVKNALQAIKQPFRVITNFAEFNSVDKIILPGVGAAAFAMQQLKKQNLITAIQKTKKPFLGICLGLQLLAEFSEEGQTACLGLIKGNIKRFSEDLKVPQIGWNKVKTINKTPLTDGLNPENYFYFVNSYYLEFSKQYAIATADYIETFTSILKYKNFYATQFHPERSGKIGLQLLSNFCNKCK